MTAGLMHNSTDPNSANELEGRYIYSADRTAVVSSKIKGGGKCIYVNRTRYTDAVISKAHC